MKQLLWFILISTGLPCLQARAQFVDFVHLDENLSRVLKFHAADTVTVVYPDDYYFTNADSAFVESYVFWGQFQKKPVYIYKKERQITNGDRKKNIQYYGHYSGFQNAEILQFPVRKTSAGFTFNNEQFNQAGDAFFYINDDATRLFTCRNSSEAPFPLRDLPLGFYTFNILRNGEFVYNGFVSDKSCEQNLNNLNKLRRNYFSNPIKSGYFEFYGARSFDLKSLENIAEKLTLFVDSLCRFLGTDTAKVPVTRIYIYENMEDLQHFLALPHHMTIFGKSLPGSNHITGNNLPTLYHETGHTVIDNTLGKNQNPFWQEGFRQYSDYFFHPEAFLTDLNVFCENYPLLTEELVLSGNTQFFNDWANYSISGVFVKYIIDKIGLKAFKAAYSRNNLEELFSKNGLSVAGLIQNLKKKTCEMQNENPN